MNSFAPLSSVRCRGLALALVCAAFFTNPGAHAASALAELIAEARTTDEFDPRKVAAVYRETVLRGEGIDRVVSRLEAFSRQPGLSDQARARLHLAAAHLRWRDGGIDSAMSSSSRAMELAPDADTLLLQARLLDAGGESERARDLYVRAAEASGEGEEQWLIRTRLAMMDASRIDVESLEKLALRRDRKFRNQVAVAVALLGRPERAIELYEPRAEDGGLYRQHLRVADWALTAREHGLAREQAWLAYAEAEVRLDRRYALALLSESYRETGELDRLLADLALRGVGDEEVLRLRVETLIETEEYGRAIELYRQLEGSEAEIHQRSRLVSLYEAAGDSDGMVREYERLMQSEPDQVQWYDGLAAHYLYRAEPGQSLQVWQALEERHSERAEILVEAARLMLKMGFTAESMAMIERHLKAHGPDVRALLFLFETQLEMGQDNEALDVLARLDEFLPSNAAERRDLADAYERVSRPREAVRVFEEIRDSGGGLGYDEQMRLAWLYGTSDRKRDALRQWQEIWLGVESPARRFFVEEQMMLLAAELGALGEMALELEAKLSGGTASRHHMSLLVRIYAEAGDKLSATEIIREYASGFGENEIGHQMLLAQVYSQLEDYSAYDRALRRLHEIDPENREDHIKSILVNLLTFDLVNGSNQRFEEINRWIGELRELDAGIANAEFVGGIYSRAGFSEQALESYRRALVNQPDNSDLLLLMADLLKNHGRADEAVALLQYFAEHAVADNEFVVAVDGIINMLGASRFFAEPDPENIRRLDWTRRVILERIAGSTGKFYFLELLADIAREKGEPEVTFRALENSLAEAGIRRPAVLRELLTMSTPSAGFAGYNTGAGDIRRQMKYGRRLVGLRLQWPPEVYIEIGKSLLNKDDLSGAERAFEMIDDITGLMDVNLTKARILEQQGYEQESLKHYNRALSVNRDSLELLHKAGLLSEARGSNEVAFRRYLEAIVGLVRRQASELAEGPPPVNPDPLQALRGIRTDESVSGEFRKHYPSLEQGLLLNWPDDARESARAVGQLQELFEDELANVLKRSGGNFLAFPRYARLDRAARLIRRVGFYLNEPGITDSADIRLLEHFGDDVEFQADLRKRYGQAGRQVPGTARRTSTSGSSVEDESVSLLRKQLSLAEEREDFRARLELLRLEAATDEIKALLVERIRDGHYREGFGYARACLGGQQFRELVLSVAPGLIEDRTALLKFLGLDSEMYMHVEDVAGRSLVPDGKVLELLTSPQAWEIAGDIYADTVGFWQYLQARSGIEDRTRYLKALIEHSIGGGMTYRLDPAQLFRDVLREELSNRERREISDMLIEYLAKQDRNDQDVRYMLRGFSFFGDAHLENLPVLFRVLEYIADRWSSAAKTRPFLEAFYGKRFGAAFAEYANLIDQDPELKYSIVGNRELNEGLANVRSRVVDALVSGQPVDVKLARAAYELEFPQWRDRFLDVEELERKAMLLELLLERYPDQGSLRHDLVYVRLQLGETGRAREAVAREYRDAPENEAWRLAYFLLLISEQRFSEALALARDGAADYSDTQVLQQALRSQFQNPQWFAIRPVIQHLQGSSGWAPAAMQNIGLPGSDATEHASVRRLREAVLASNQDVGRVALRESWRRLLAPDQGPYQPAPGATPLPLFADSLLSATIDDPAESESASLSSVFGNFLPLVVVPHMPVSKVFTPIDAGDDEPQPPRTLFHAVSQSPYAAWELDAYLRAMPDKDRKSFFRLYEFLASAYLAAGNRELLHKLSARVASGEIDDHNFTLWMLLRDQRGTEFDAGEQDAFERRLDEMTDPSSYQLLLAARLLAASGSTAKAVEHYKLVAARRIQHGEYMYPTRGVVVSVTNADAFANLSALMEEAAERLPAEPAREVIDGVLEITRWAENTQAAESLLHALALSWLDRVYSPRELRAQAREWSAAVLQRPESLLAAGGPKAVELVRLHARSGNLRHAVELLGDILKHPDDGVLAGAPWGFTMERFDDGRAVQALSQLNGMELLDDVLERNPKQAGGVGELLHRQDRFLPTPGEDWPYAREWIAVLAEELLGWLEKRELTPAQVVPLYVAAVMYPAVSEASPADAPQPGELLEDLLTAIDAGKQPMDVAGLTGLAPLAKLAGRPIPIKWAADVLVGGRLSWQERLDLLLMYAGTEYEARIVALFREAGLDFGLEVPRQLLAMAESVRDDAYAADLRERVSLEEAARAALQPSEQG